MEEVKVTRISLIPYQVLATPSPLPTPFTHHTHSVDDTPPLERAEDCYDDSTEEEDSDSDEGNYMTCTL